MLDDTTLILAFNLVNVTKSLEAATETFVTLLDSIASAFASRVLILVVNAATLSVIEVFKSAPSYLNVAAVSMPTSRLLAVTGEIVVFENGSFVSKL